MLLSWDNQSPGPTESLTAYGLVSVTALAPPSIAHLRAVRL